MRNYSKKRKFKKYIFLIAILSIFSYLSIFYYQNNLRNDYVIAKINNEKILKSEISYKISEIFSSNSADLKIPDIKDLPKEVIETFAKEIYLEKNLAKKAKKSEISKDQKVKYQIKQAKNRILIDAYLEDEILKNITEEKIKEKYSEISSKIQGKREFLISHILLDSENEANRIYRIYNETNPGQKNSKFKELAKKYSLDKESATKGGDLGFILEDDIAKEIFEQISEFKNSSYTKPIKTEFGWHIVMVNKIRDAEILPFEQSYENIKNQLIKEATDKIYEEIFKDYKIKILIDEKKSKDDSLKNKSS